MLESGILHLRLLWALDFMMTAGDWSPELANGSIYLYLFKPRGTRQEADMN